MSLSEARIVVIGGSSGIGLAIARAARLQGASVLIAGSNVARLADAAGQVPGLDTAVLDIRDEEQVASFFRHAGPLDHVVVTAGAAIAAAPLQTLDVDAADNAMQVKLRGSLLVAKYAAPQLGAGGSIGFTTGVLGRKPALNSLIKTVINAALEAAVRQLAKELAPLRVYAVSPGPVNTPGWNFADEASRSAMFSKLGQTLPVGFVATDDDTAAAYLFAMQARALTGAVLDLDSGALIA
ncbi:SDR family oxidoreductase [Undibacterium sp. Ji49W]|uniref:SDR family oxidoreductase n=1 Tax=Undibacterium sp. Ji49W TaxID=3413040 RepID=UPI003BF3BBA6